MTQNKFFDRVYIPLTFGSIIVMLPGALLSLQKWTLAGTLLVLLGTVLLKKRTFKVFGERTVNTLLTVIFWVWLVLGLAAGIFPTNRLSLLLFSLFITLVSALIAVPAILKAERDMKEE